MQPPRYSVYRSVLATPNRFLIAARYDVWNELHRLIILEQNRKVFITFEAGLLFSLLKCSHLAIAAKLYSPKGDRINKSLLY